MIMIKMILKNLWNRRRQNAWLFIELILVTVLTWIMTDSVVVSVADRAMPLGYDADRLVIVNVASLPATSAGYQAEYDSVDANRAAVETMVQHLRGLDGVERACYLDENPLIGGTSSISTAMHIGNPAVDTLVRNVNMVQFEAGTEFFETFGIRASDGSPSAAELSRRSMDDNDIIISRQYGELFWPGENACGKHFVDVRGNGDTVYSKVTGVVEGLRWLSPLRSYAVVFANRISSISAVEEFTVVLRLRAEVDHTDFLNSLRNRTDLRAGNFLVQTATDYTDFLYQTEEDNAIHSGQNLMLLLAAFFLLNLILGTVGCFWLQTNRRVEEIGVLRSFGARRGHIVGMLVGESVALTVAAYIIGVLAYLQYALRNGLDDGFDNNAVANVADTWVSHFGEHFAIISAIVLIILVVCVVIGTLIPAVRASRVNVADALRDE